MTCKMIGTSETNLQINFTGLSLDFTSLVPKLGLRYIFDLDKFSLHGDKQDDRYLGNKFADKSYRVEFELHVPCTQARFKISLRS
jgi:hypothetical protein